MTDHPHIFEKGTVYNWPGITSCYDWSEESDWFAAITDGEMTLQTFRRNHLGHAGKGIGWLVGQYDAGSPITGAHIHIIDYMGHIYASRPEQLREEYEPVDSLVGWLRERVDRLVIIFDHRMQTTSLDDSDPSVHSWRAMIATTEFGPLPDHVADVREYIEGKVGKSVSESTTEVDVPRQHLENLGSL